MEKAIPHTLEIGVAHVFFIMPPNEIRKPISNPDTRALIAFFITAGNGTVQPKFTPIFRAETIFETVSAAGADRSIVQDHIHIIVFLNYFGEQELEHMIIEDVLVSSQRRGDVLFI